ncbi:MAG: 5'/3'-nucleotidase SurE [Rhodospirillaceae bacterium]|nr:5'/3'-nucleotidase SurE [Rhodospirillaceae bacterium]MBT6136296.1 5'/3'-nucleotidase SurE [Rhodospirillaceae bacterium]
MTGWPLALKTSRILVTNDDGIYAPGLQVLIETAMGLSDDVWVVAPETEQTGAGHSLTLRRPLRVREADDRRFAVDGTPTDCVMMAINRIMEEHRPDLVLSGVNRGSNLGEDVTYSGTVSAAMEATILGVPAIAMSQDFSDNEAVPWGTSRRHAPDLIERLCRQGWPQDTLVNVNFPAVQPGDVRGVTVASQGRRKTGDNIVEAHDPRGQPYYWIGGVRKEEDWSDGTDLAAVAAGRIAVTPISIDFTDYRALHELEQVFV